jgi:hypothetical protein
VISQKAAADHDASGPLAVAWRQVGSRELHL